jgi:hypothetical protein
MTAAAASNPAIHAVVRATASEQLAIVANVADRAVDGASLDLETGPICGPVGTTTLLYRSDGPSAAPVAIATPGVTASGGFRGWAPLPSIPARTAFVIGLVP